MTFTNQAMIFLVLQLQIHFKHFKGYLLYILHFNAKGSTPFYTLYIKDTFYSGREKNRIGGMTASAKLFSADFSYWVPFMCRTSSQLLAK